MYKNPTLKRVIYTTIFLSFLFVVNAQYLTRGPYLQSPTENSIVLKWRTDVNTNSKVLYGTDTANLNVSVVLNNSTKEHVVKLMNLSPSTRYYYSIGNNLTSFTAPSSRYQFKTNPTPGNEVQTRVWAIGDFGKGNTEQVAVKNSYMQYDDSLSTDVWIWLGDNVYNDGTDQEYQAKLFELNGFSDIFSWLPFWPSPGNHDYNTVWAESSFLGIPYSNIPLEDHQGPYYDLVHVPTQAEAGGYPSQLELFYSFDYGDVHFLSLISEVYDFTQTFDGINQMKQWIEQDLSQNSRTFTIAYFHQPPYSKGSHDSDDAFELVMKTMREQVIPLLESYDVDLVICGHSHVFERSKLVHGHYGNSASYDASTMLKDGSNGNFSQGNAYRKDGLNSTPDGTVYVVCGNSGSKEDSPALNYPIMQFVDGGLEACGSFILDIYKNRLDGKYLHMNGAVMDEFTILKSNLTVDMEDVIVCNGETVTLSPSISGGSDQLHYVWSVNNSTTSQVQVSDQTLGNFTLTVTDSLTGQVETIPFTVSLSGSLVIENWNDTLISSGSNTGYQWYLNGEPLPGANTSIYIPQESGMYTVSTENGTCESHPYSYNVDLSVQLLSSTSVLLYPNPVAEELYLIVPIELLNEEFKIVDATGKTIKQGKINDEESILNMSDLRTGTYILTLIRSSEKFKVIKK